MKKLALFFASILLLAACGNRTDNTIKYDGPQIVDIVLLEELNLNATSDEPLTYYSDNDLYVTVTDDGVIKGKNVGEANITISNSVNTITIKVLVSLFEEPTFDFGISQDDIKKIYGDPRFIIGDSIFIYGSGNEWYSYAVWEMDFFFNDNEYTEADLYIREDVNTRLNQFLSENYFVKDTIYDTIDDVMTTCYLYLNENNPDDANVLLGQLFPAGRYDDVCLFYTAYDNSEKKSFKDIYKRNKNRRLASKHCY